MYKHKSMNETNPNCSFAFEKKSPHSCFPTFLFSNVYPQSLHECYASISC